MPLNLLPTHNLCRQKNWVVGPHRDPVKLRVPSLHLGHGVTEGHHSTKSGWQGPSRVLGAKDCEKGGSSRGKTATGPAEYRRQVPASCALPMPAPNVRKMRKSAGGEQGASVPLDLLSRGGKVLPGYQNLGTSRLLGTGT